MVRMNPKLLQRRQDMWDHHLTGARPSVFIPKLAVAYNVKEETLWVDWGKKKNWSALLFQLENSKAILKHRLYELQRAKQKCFHLMETADNGSAKVGAIKQLIEIIKLEIQIYQSVGWLHKEPDKIDLDVRGMAWHQNPIAQKVFVHYQRIITEEENALTQVSTS